MWETVRKFSKSFENDISISNRIGLIKIHITKFVDLIKQFKVQSFPHLDNRASH